MKASCDTGVDDNWLPDLPASWKRKRLKHLFQSTSGGTPSKDRIDFWIGDIPWVSPKDMKTEYILDTEDHISEEAVAESATMLVPSNTILVVTRSGILRHTIPVAITTRNMAINQDLKALIPRVRNVFPAYYAALIRGFQAQLLMIWRKQGATVESLETDTIGMTVVPLPPFAQQRSIAEFLDRETTKIDTLIERQTEFLTRLQEHSRAIIDDAVMHGLDPEATVVDSGNPWMGSIPSHWQIRSIGSVSTKITNGYVGPTRDILVDEGVVYLQSLHIKNNQIKFDGRYFVESAWSNAHCKSILREGDVLIVQTGDIGQVAVVTSEFAGANCHALIIVSSIKGIIEGRYLSWVLNSAYGIGSLQAIQTGALHPHLNCGNVKFLRVPVPPISEQQAISSHIESELNRCEILVNRAQTLIQVLIERRAALITAAVTGQIDIAEPTMAEAAA